MKQLSAVYAVAGALVAGAAQADVPRATYQVDNKVQALGVNGAPSVRVVSGGLNQPSVTTDLECAMTGPSVEVFDTRSGRDLVHAMTRSDVSRSYKNMGGRELAYTVMQAETDMRAVFTQARNVCAANGAATVTPKTQEMADFYRNLDKLGPTR